MMGVNVEGHDLDVTRHLVGYASQIVDVAGKLFDVAENDDFVSWN